MDFRSQFIKDPQHGLLGIFERIKNNPRADDPIEIGAIGVGLQVPAQLPVSALPAIFFGYGDSERLEVNQFTDTQAEQFTVNIFAQVNRTRTSDLIERAGAMRLLIDRVRDEVRSLSVSSDVYLRNVVVSSATVDRRDLSEDVFMNFGLTYIYEYA